MTLHTFSIVISKNKIQAYTFSPVLKCCSQVLMPVRAGVWAQDLYSYITYTKFRRSTLRPHHLLHTFTLSWKIKKKHKNLLQNYFFKIYLQNVYIKCSFTKTLLQLHTVVCTTTIKFRSHRRKKDKRSKKEKREKRRDSGQKIPETKQVCTVNATEQIDEGIHTEYSSSVIHKNID